MHGRVRTAGERRTVCTKQPPGTVRARIVAVSCVRDTLVSWSTISSTGGGGLGGRRVSRSCLPPPPEAPSPEIARRVRSSCVVARAPLRRPGEGRWCMRSSWGGPSAAWVARAPRRAFVQNCSVAGALAALTLHHSTRCPTTTPSLLRRSLTSRPPGSIAKHQVLSHRMAAGKRAARLRFSSKAPSFKSAPNSTHTPTPPPPPLSKARPHTQSNGPPPPALPPPGFLSPPRGRAASLRLPSASFSRPQ